MTTRREGCAKRLTARADRFDLFRNNLDLPLPGRILLAAGLVMGSWRARRERAGGLKTASVPLT
ncbi:MAG TPA: hypothetical protein VFU74_07885 [Actinocrinis sp.]|nr:hypothetical protein [Actinocrinis sp.]